MGKVSINSFRKKESAILTGGYPSIVTLNFQNLCLKLHLCPSLKVVLVQSNACLSLRIFKFEMVKTMYKNDLII